MCDKYFIFFTLIFILITESLGEDGIVRGSRNYNPDLPEVQALPVQSRTGNEGYKIRENITNSNQNFTISVNYEQQKPWEPLACSRCVPNRYLAHYEERGCKPVNSQYHCRKPCPKYYQCPKKTNNTQIEGCEYKGKVYAVRSQSSYEEIPITDPSDGGVKDPCKRPCFCDQDVNQANSSQPIYRIRCSHVDCPQNFPSGKPNCFMIYEEGKCCPREKCLTPEQIKTEPKCLYDGKYYNLREKIYPRKIDPCLECICDNNWNQTKPEYNKSCRKTKCDLQSNGRFRAGCLPIYQEGICCPIEYFCLPPEEQTCKFNGKNYLIGEKIDIGLERTECKCLVPPDFTCIKRPVTAAPLNGTDDYIKKFQTLPTVNITNNFNNSFEFNPKLDPGFGQCPPFIPEGLKCAGYNCTTIIDRQGCQACSCEAACGLMSKCREGCRMEATTPGVCPRCVCD